MFFVVADYVMFQALPLSALLDFFEVTLLQPWPVTISVSVWSEPALCLVHCKPRVKLCAYGRQLCRQGTKMFQTLRSVYVGWSRPRVRAGRRGENRGRRSASRHSALAQSVTIIKWGMRM